jgi:hypothetical protein
VPLIVAVNCCVALVRIEAEVGVIETATGGGAVVTVTDADAFFVVSATLVAVTV